MFKKYDFYCSNSSFHYSKGYCSLLFVAAGHGQVDLVELLVSRGAAINARTCVRIPNSCYFQFSFSVLVLNIFAFQMYAFRIVAIWIIFIIAG